MSLLAHLTLSYDCEMVNELLGSKPRLGDSDLQVRVIRHFDEYTETYHPSLSFCRKTDDDWNAHVVSHATFSKLRLYHFLDLIRLVIEPNYQTNANFTITAFATLRPLASECHLGDLISLSSFLIQSLPEQASLPSMFYRRWCYGHAVIQRDIKQLLEMKLPSSLTIHRLPKV
jgi:hypothetical protein